MSADGDLEIELCGERLVLLPEPTAYRPSDRSLLVADPHFVKAAAFRAHAPLAFPLLVDRTREAVSSESMADRVRRVQVALEKAADAGR